MRFRFLGMDFKGDKTAVAVFMLVVLAFFWVSFVFRGLQDYKQLAREMAQVVRDSISGQVDEKALSVGQEITERMLMGLRPKATPAYFGLSLADYWMPLGFGLVAFVILLFRTICGFGYG